MNLHPLCTLFPRLVGPEFDAFVDDIRTSGLREPIVTYAGAVLDGGNRLRACEAAKVRPHFREFEGDDIVGFVLSQNLHRRHMTAGQQAAIVASVQDWSKAKAHGGDRKSDQSATLHLDSAADRAATSGASLRTQKTADKVARANPKLAAQVGRGEISLPQAVERLAPKKPVAQPTPKPSTRTAAGSQAPSRIEELEAKVAELEGLLCDSRENAATLADELVACDAVRNGDEVKKMRELQGQLRTVESQRNDYLNENAALKKEVKRLQRRLGEGTNARAA